MGITFVSLLNPKAKLAAINNYKGMTTYKTQRAKNALKLLYKIFANHTNIACLADERLDLNEPEEWQSQAPPIFPSWQFHSWCHCWLSVLASRACPSVALSFPHDHHRVLNLTCLKPAWKAFKSSPDISIPGGIFLKMAYAVKFMPCQHG